MPSLWNQRINEAVNTKTEADIDLLLMRQNVNDKMATYSEDDLIGAIDRCEATLKALRVADLDTIVSRTG